MKSSDNFTDQSRVVCRVVNHLAAEEYQQLQILSRGVRLNAHQLEQAVKDYGRKIAPLPQEAIPLIDYVAISNSNPEAWSVYCPIFTAEEGRSDLTLDLTLQINSQLGYSVQINGLHVM